MDIKTSLNLKFVQVGGECGKAYNLHCINETICARMGYYSHIISKTYFLRKLQSRGTRPTDNVTEL